MTLRLVSGIGTFYIIIRVIHKIKFLCIVYCNMKKTVIEKCLQEINVINEQIKNETDDAILVILHAIRDEKLEELEGLIKTQLDIAPIPF
jgi:hypothetical protein